MKTLTALALVLLAAPVAAQDIVVTFTLTGAAADAARAQQAANEAIDDAFNVEVQGQRDSITATNSANANACSAACKMLQNSRRGTAPGPSPALGAHHVGVYSPVLSASQNAGRTPPP